VRLMSPFRSFLLSRIPPTVVSWTGPSLSAPRPVPRTPSGTLSSPVRWTGWVREERLRE
jgi:hypothetical protein